MNVNEEYLTEDSIKKIKDLLIPYETEYTKIRLGRTEDGGYVFLGELLTDVNTVYSLGYGGVADIDIFSAENGKKVYLYDDVWDSMLSTHENISFQKVFVTSNFFNNVLENNKENSLLMCDIEGSEYEVLTNLNEEYLQQFSQISIEIHGVVTDDRQKVLNLLTALNKHFYLTHIHANNFVYDDVRYIHYPVTHGMPDVIECLYVRKDLCNNVKISEQSFPLPLIDFANNQSKPDIELNWWLNK